MLSLMIPRHRSVQLPSVTYNTIIAEDDTSSISLIVERVWLYQPLMIGITWNHSTFTLYQQLNEMQHFSVTGKIKLYKILNCHFNQLIELTEVNWIFVCSQKVKDVAYLLRTSADSHNHDNEKFAPWSTPACMKAAQLGTYHFNEQGMG